MFLKNKYKVLIIGLKINDIKQSKSIFQLLSYYVFLGFKKLENVEVFYCDRLCQELPIVDFVLAMTYLGDEINVDYLREKTKAIKICSLHENLSSYDFNFVFNSHYNGKKSHSFPPPCNKKLLKPTPKKKKTILIDHYWEDFLETDKDWTFKIENWLENIEEEYEIYRLIRFKNEEKNIKSFEIPIFYSDYVTYLENTSHIETFIITHFESYSYGIIDMAARGTRIITPPNLIPICIIETFSISIFKNRNDFLRVLNNKINVEKLNKQIDCCIDYFDIAKEINGFFNKWIEEKNVNK